MAHGGGSPHSSSTGDWQWISSMGAGSAGSAGVADSSVASRQLAGVGGACALTLCGSRNTSVGESGIDCNRCNGWFHLVDTCMGLSDKVIETIITEEGKGILFVCLSCRINHPPVKRSRRASDESDLTRTINNYSSSNLKVDFWWGRIQYSLMSNAAISLLLFVKAFYIPFT